MKNTLLKILLLVVGYIWMGEFAIAFMLMYANPLTLIVTVPIILGTTKLAKIIDEKIDYSNPKKWSS